MVSLFMTGADYIIYINSIENCGQMRGNQGGDQPVQPYADGPEGRRGVTHNCSLGRTDTAAAVPAASPTAW